ncbi:aminotransferase class I/II-fold pyridoxal phosphate-dependent enzyme, partial [Marinomonas sp.]
MDISHLLTPRSLAMESSLVRELLHYSQQPNIISLAGGLPDESLMPAYPDLNVLRDSRQYGASDGEGSLRKSIDTLLSDRGLHQPRGIMVTNGSQQGLDIISRLILDEHSTILTEQPTYLAACQVFTLQGANVQGVASDDEGLLLSDLERLIDLHNPKAVYLIPNFQNPTGHRYGLARRQEIAALLDEKDIL